MNMNFFKMMNKLKTSSDELLEISKLDLTDSITKYELELKFVELNKIISILKEIIYEEREDESLQLLSG